jgi:hypothetical protein
LSDAVEAGPFLFLASFWLAGPVNRNRSPGLTTVRWLGIGPLVLASDTPCIEQVTPLPVVTQVFA